MYSYLESTARQRAYTIVDEGSFIELSKASLKNRSKHLELLDLPVSFDDGVIIGKGRIAGKDVYILSQEGKFLGGGVGEIHGAKITGLLKLALKEKPDLVLLLLDSGGVRLHEANAGLIGISEILKALMALKAKGIKVYSLIGGQTGCFGGMSIVASCADALIMSEESRFGLSGPEVIETVKGVEEFDSRDKATVWQTFGGKHRYLLGDANYIVEDSISSFRNKVIDLLNDESKQDLLKHLENKHKMLKKRLLHFEGVSDALEICKEYNLADKDIGLLPISQFIKLVKKNINKNIEGD